MDLTATERLQERTRGTYAIVMKESENGCNNIPCFSDVELRYPHPGVGEDGEGRREKGIDGW